MRCVAQNIQATLEQFNSFCDSVFCGFTIAFSDESLPFAEIVLECKDAEDNKVKVSITIANLVGWSFVNMPKQSSDFLTEGLRFAFVDDFVRVEFGSDPDVDLFDPAFWRASVKWLIGKELTIERVDVKTTEEEKGSGLFD